MNTSLKSILTAVTLAAAALLTGCATLDRAATFTRGDEVVYGRVENIWTGDKFIKTTNDVLCSDKKKALKYESNSEEIDSWLTENKFCEVATLKKFKLSMVRIGVVNVNGDAINLGGIAPENLPLAIGDIVAIKVYPSSDGRFRRPSEILRVAAKAKDATKKNGCYWDAGTGMWAGFNQGGAICEGWHWKDHPLSNPDLLKK